MPLKVEVLMGVSGEKVNQLIQEALGKGGEGAGCCDTVQKAFQYLKSRRREPGNSTDLNLAAAEHYMFARWMVCSGHVSFRQMMALVICYDVAKILDQKGGGLVFPIVKATTGNPLSQPDIGVVLWGMIGALTGQGHHDRCNKDANPPLWRPIREIAPTAVGF